MRDTQLNFFFRVRGQDWTVPDFVHTRIESFDLNTELRARPRLLLAHADYAFAFLDAGKPFWLRRSVSANYVTPQVRYLIRATDYRRMRYDARATVSSDYGLPA